MGVLLLALLSLFSGGFFLYAVLVVVGLYVLTLAVVSTSLVGIKLERHVGAGDGKAEGQEEIELGRSVAVRLVLENTKELPAPWLFWHDHLDAGLDLEGPACAFRSLPGSGSEELSYRLHSLRRGLFRIGPAVVEASGPFGLVRRFRIVAAPHFLLVLPRGVAIGQGFPLGQRPVHEIPRRRSLFEDPTRFLGIRDYRRGDEYRRIHWRATARAQKLMVKLYEPSVLEGVLVAVEARRAAYPDFDPAAEMGDPLLELTVTAAASVAEFVLGGDQRVGLLTNGADAAERFGDDWGGGSFRRLSEALEEAEGHRKTAAFRPLEVEPAKGGRQLARLRTALARLDLADGPSLPEVLDVELPRLPRSLVLVVVTPELSPALGETLRALRRSGIESAVIWTGAAVHDAAAGDAAAGDGVAQAVGAMPAGVPVHPVAREEDLELVGGIGL